MRPLFDQNLPPRLVVALAVPYPGSRHVSTVGLERASDRRVSDYATARIEEVLRAHHTAIARLDEERDARVLSVG